MADLSNWHPSAYMAGVRVICFKETGLSTELRSKVWAEEIAMLTPTMTLASVVRAVIDKTEAKDARTRRNGFSTK